MIAALSIDGGWSTDFGPSAPFNVKGTGVAGEVLVSVPWLVEAQNLVYNLDGWPQKMPGASNVNATATGASDHVTGIFDYWRSRNAGNPAQQRLLYAGTAIYSESGGTLTAIKTGLEAETMPWFEVMNDECVIATTSTTDVPMVWDQTTFANLAGSPPNFAIFEVHKGRMFAAGVDTNKSRLYYTALNNHEDWTGSGSGSIDVAADDGDQITGVKSHRNELVIFKGPNRGSIHRLAGSSPTGDDAFSLNPFVRGVGASNHHAIILGPGADLWFWDDHGIHSLAAVEAFGDYAPRRLSAPISDYFVEELNHNRFSYVWGVNFAGAGYALWTVSRSGSTTNDRVLLLDYRFQPMRLALWTSYSAACLAMVRDASRQTIPWAGTYTGRALRMHRPARNIAEAAYTARALLPYLPFGDEFIDKIVMKGRCGLAPKGEINFTVGWQRDAATQQTTAVSQEGTATLAPSSDQFTLDTDILAGARHVSRFFDMSGSFKELQFEFSQGGGDQDFEPHSFALELEVTGIGTTDVTG